MNKKEILKPCSLKKGDTVGIFTPSFPAHCEFRNKYEHGLIQLEETGFRVKEGHLKW